MSSNLEHTLYHHELSLDGGGTVTVASFHKQLDLSQIEPVAVVSGGYDPIHRGHIVNVNEAARIAGAGAYGPVVVIANGDRFLQEKRKQDPSIPAPFLPLEDRMATVANLKPVVFVIESIDEDQTVCATLDALVRVQGLEVRWFANGGDRKEGMVPEEAVCQKNGIELVFDCGTIKENSSSSVLRRAALTAADASHLHADTRWGHFCTLAENGSWATKMLRFNGGCGLSLQIHHRREEELEGVEGEGIVCLGALDKDGRQIYQDGMPVCGSVERVFPGRSIKVALGQAHMTCNVQDTLLRVHETWIMTDPDNPSDEEDIIRFGDPFNNEADQKLCQDWVRFSFPFWQADKYKLSDNG